MFTVVFQVHPGPGKKDDYLAHANGLKPLLESVDGFIDNERFESRRREGWILSLSTWRDEKAVVRWRTVGKHHDTQETGRERIFSDYSLRVCEVTSDTHVPDGMQVVEQRFDTSAVAEAKALAITEITPIAGTNVVPHADLLTSHLGLDAPNAALVDHDAFAGITIPGKLLLLTLWRTAEDADRWTPSTFAGAARVRHRRMRNIREYGMFERREAPQYYPDVATPAGCPHAASRP